MQERDERYQKKLAPGDQPKDDSPASYRTTLLSLKHNLVKNLKWTLHDVDEADFHNLLSFLNFKPSDDPNVRVINGKTYRRANIAPSWI
ncbi:hypothetical protein NSS82_10335 [Paenibacillus sp. FSL H7-0735]|uniref:hypothetical protein n=1 Tax=Paenibacillus sp. FSL H7-0735 TaxID=2954736 RepID=UPI0030FAB205